MQLGITGNIDFDESSAHSDNLLFLGFHGYSNDESEMVRIINAIYDVDRHSSDCYDTGASDGNSTAACIAGHTAAASINNTVTDATHSPIVRRPNYLSFRAPYARPYIGGHYWYPDGCSVSERRHACTEVGNSVVKMLDSQAFQQFRKVLIGFSQGGYLSYRMVAEHPDTFDAAILLSPSFKGEAASEPPMTRTRFALCYGTADHTIPVADQQCAREKLSATGRCTFFEYPGMAHNICDQEIADVRAWLGL